MPVTFDVDQKAGPVEPRLKPVSVREVISPHFGEQQYSVLKSTDSAIVKMPFSNGFIGSALTAYNQHMHLVWSPDDVWIAITQALAGYVDRHADAMRDSFVSFEGKKTLAVTAAGTIQTVNWDDLIAQMSTLIDENTKAEVGNWMTAEFTTTTTLSRTVSKVVCMSAMKHYFEYHFYLECGLPKVTLLGERSDWVNIVDRAKRLATLGPELRKWHAALEPVLLQCVSAFEGQVDAEFWNRIACETGGGSSPLCLSGWILVFCPWDNDGTYCYRSMECGKVPSGYVDCPVLINDNGIEFKCKFVAGSMGASFDEETRQLRPSLDWVMLHELN